MRPPIRIRVQSFAAMRRYSAPLQPSGVLEAAAGVRVGDVLDHLGVPPTQELILLVNGRPAGRDRVLEDDDLLVFFPPLEGG